MVQSQEVGIGIGDLATRCGVSVDTVRFYERRGVLPAPARRPSGYRVYDDTSVSRLLMARQLRRVGLTVGEIADALGSHSENECGSELWRLEAARDRIDGRLRELTDVRNRLTSVIAACAGGQCPMA